MTSTRYENETAEQRAARLAAKRERARLRREANAQGEYTFGQRAYWHKRRDDVPPPPKGWRKASRASSPPPPPPPPPMPSTIKMRHLERLGLCADALFADVRKAYRALALRHHPDKGGDAELFKDVQNAYEYLAEAMRV